LNIKKGAITAMMKLMRKLTKQILWIVIAAFIGTIIFAWGMEFSSKNKKAGVIATVNGEDIQAAIFQQYYDQALRQTEKEKGEVDDQTAYQLRDDVWNNMVNQVLLNEQMEKRKIQVTDAELYDYLRRYPPKELQENPAFKTKDGKFDYQKYLQALSDPRVPWKQVEDYIRPNLELAKLQQSIITMVRVTGDETKQYFRDQNERIKVDYLLVPSYQFQGGNIQVSDNEISAYYQEHKKDFEGDQGADLSYVMFEKKPDQVDVEDAKKRLLEIKDDILAGEDFGDMAKDYSEDKASAVNGGDLGWFKKGMMVPAFEEAAFSLKPGEISDPIQTQFGWHLIKVTDRKTEGGVEEVKASHILLKVTPSEETLAKIKGEADDFAEKISKGDFSKIAGESNLPVQETGWFTPGSSIKGVGKNSQVDEFAFNNDVGKISDVLETVKGFYVFQIKARRPAGIATLDEVKPTIRQILTKNKADSLAYEKAQLIYSQIKAGKSLKVAAEQNNATYAEPAEFTVSSPPAEIKAAPEFIGKTLSLSTVGEISPPVETDLGAFIIQLASRSVPDDSVYAAIKDSLSYVVLQKKQGQAYQDWFSRIRKQADIKDYRSSYYRESGE
jgi:peptidyl-prolyl cis-trans isomerase D